MPTSLTPDVLEPVFAPLAVKPHEHDRFARQPVHTIYGGAHLFRFDTAHKLGRIARAAFDETFPDDATLTRELGLRAPAALVRDRVRNKLASEPVEDLRIDFEDGYGPRPDAEEDAHAEAAAQELAKGIREGTLPAGIGIRIKALSAETHARAARTLDLVLTTLVRENVTIPASFVITLPKVVSPAEVAALADLLGLLERALGLATDTLQLELMIETPRSLIAGSGAIALPALVAAARGRCRAVHVGSYDLTASLGISAEHQALAHPACDFAKHLLQTSLAGAGIALSDGATTVLPIARHRAAALTPDQLAENRTEILAAARLHASNVRHGLAGGFWQGWDLHPAQIPIRYAVLHDFFLHALPGAATRLRHFLDSAAQASRVGAVFDDAATGQGLLNFFLRGVSCGALDAADLALAGLTADELAHRSFPRLLASRRAP